MERIRMNAVGTVLNRSARKQKMDLLLDPSREAFLSRAAVDKSRLTIVLRPDLLPDIELTGIPVGCRLKLRDVQLKDPSQIGLLEFMINDEAAAACQIELAYTPQQEELPFDPDEPVASKACTIDADGFVTNPIQHDLPVPEFLSCSVGLLFAILDGKWYTGFVIWGRVVAVRRINKIRDLGFLDLTQALSRLKHCVEDALSEDRSRLFEFIGYKIDKAIEVIALRNATLAEAMAEEIHFPAEFHLATCDASPQGQETTEPENATAEDAKDAETQSSHEPQVTVHRAGAPLRCIAIPMPTGVRGVAEITSLQNGNDGCFYGGFRLSAPKVDILQKAGEGQAGYSEEFTCLLAMAGMLKQQLSAVPAKAMPDTRKARIMMAIDETMDPILDGLELENGTAEDAEDAEDETGHESHGTDADGD